MTTKRDLRAEIKTALGLRGSIYAGYWNAMNAGDRKELIAGVEAGSFTTDQAARGIIDWHTARAEPAT